jgi:hypothetical protein
MAQLTKSLDDTLPEVTCPDISGGLNLQDGALSLAPNQTFSCFNVIGFKGRTIYAGGFSEYTAGGVPAGADGNWEFYDVNNAKHIIEWRGGNMYDTVNGILVTINIAIYVPGQNIGRIDQNGVLYWTTATVPLRAYNGTTDVPVIDSGATGSVAIPSGTCLCAYAGSIVVGNPTIAGVSYPGTFIPSNVNDATTFLGANQTATGANNFIQAMVPMGIAAGGVPPTNSIMIVGSEFLILAQGAVNALKLNSVNVPMGCQDGNSVAYIPTGDLLGVVVYQGNDNQFWETNGITGDCISKQLLNWLNLTIQSSKETNPNIRFSGSYNGRYQYYICDLGMNQMLVYRWQQKAWYYVSGWPSGFICEGTTGIGFPCNYISSNGSFTAATYLVGQDNINFNGTVPVISFSTPYLHGGDSSELKEYQWVYMEMNNLIPAAYNVQASGLPFQGGELSVSNTLLFPNPLLNTALLSNYGIWNVSLWNVGLWGPGESTFPQQPSVVSGMLAQTVAPNEWISAATTQPFRSAATTVNISWTNNGVANAIPDFDVGKVYLSYKPMGHRMVGGTLGSAQSGASGTAYPWS